MTFDGEAQCIAPTYAPAQYTVCDIGAPYGYKITAWNQCAALLSIPNPITSESQAVSYANCWNQKISGVGDVVGTVPWKSAGTVYNDNSCVAGTVREVDGHTIWGVGNKTSASGGTTFTFTKVEPVSCPGGYTAVSFSIRGFSELVACKPVTTCAPDERPSSNAPYACMKNANLPAVAKPCFHCIGNPILPLTGAKRQPVSTGFFVGGEELVITYDTSSALTGFPVRALPSFGRLWSSSLHRNLVIGSGGTVVTAYRGNGQIWTFILRGGTYVTDGDTLDKLTVASGAYYYTDGRTNTVESYNALGQLRRIDWPDGRSLSFVYSSANAGMGAGYLLRVTDHTGRFIRFRYQLTPGALIHKATRGRVSAILDFMGRRINVTYDAQSNLSTLTWPGGKTQQFLYENGALPWAMTGRINESSVRDRTWAYDGQGRAIESSIAGAGAHTVAYDSPPTYSVSATEDASVNVFIRRFEAAAAAPFAVTQPNGQVASWGSQSVLGLPRLASVSKPAGSGSPAATAASTYDVNGNVVTYDDFGGARTCYAYDSTNRETVRVAGLATSIDCATVIGAGATLPAGAQRTTTAWHPDWRLPSAVTRPLRKTTTVYQGQPDPFNSNTPANCTTAALLPNGKPRPVVCKQVEQALLASGALDTTVPMDVQIFSYNAAARPVAITRNGNATTQTYYATTSFPSGMSDLYGDKVNLVVHGDFEQDETLVEDYSAAQQPVYLVGDAYVSTEKSKFGGASMHFDGSGDYLWIDPSDFNIGTGDFTAEGWFYLEAANLYYPHIFQLASTQGWMFMRFGDSGYGWRLQFATSTNGSQATQYSAAQTQSDLLNGWHHLAMTRESGVVRAFLDGDLLTVRNNVFTGPAVTSWVDNTNIIATQVSLSADAPFSFQGYIDEFRFTKGVARYTSSFTPPAAPFEAPSLTTTGVAAGDLQSVTNAAGHTTQFTKYDRAGRVRQTVDPRGLVSDIEYTPRGSVSSVTVTPPGGGHARTTAYGYDERELLTQVVEADGTVVSYGYDEAGRLLQVTDARGNSVTYTLDVSGNRIAEEAKDPGGTLRRNIQRSYDALNRLQQVTGGAR
ncbi:LamG-like jellyroll fold domain-containing protein [Ramlibacter humi]|nr:LamG-like jellyroll fold domain-containing protein [Ramlibacter humi]